MEKIYLHIEKLLARYEYVVVSGLGGFVLQYEPAKIVDNILHAPCKVIAFNALMCHSDGLLEIEISRSEQVSYRKAQEILNTAIERFRQELELKKSVDFGNFGTYFYSEEGGMSFIPASKPTFIPSNIGLKNLQLTDVKVQALQTSTQNRNTISTRSVLRYAATVALLLSMLFVSEKVNYKNHSQTAAILSLSKFQTAAITVDTLALSTSKLNETIIPETISQKNDSDLYHVIVGSMPSQESADAYCKQLNEKSFECAHVLKPIRTYRVAIKSFDDKMEAIAYMEQLRLSDKQFETAWVLCR